MNLGLSICMYIHFLPQHLSQDWQISFFFIFCLKFRDHKYLKLTELNFLGKFSLARKWANLPICPFLQHFSQNWLLNFFFIFCRKLRDHKYSKLMELIFLKNSGLPENRSKRPKVAWFVCSFVMRVFFQDWLISLFWYFAWSRGSVSTKNIVPDQCWFMKL